MNFQFKWLGQGGFLFELDGFNLVVDPYLSNAAETRVGLHRLMPAPVTLAELRPDAVICTHDHLDHYDPETVPQLMSLFPQCHLVGPKSVRAKAIVDGIESERFFLIDCGDKINLGPCKITALPARHSDPLAIGLMIEFAGQKIYLSGDTEYFSELPDAVKSAVVGNIDIAFICINGKYGNMNWRQAAAVVEAIRPRLAIPMHYGMFAKNTVNPENFILECDKHQILARKPIPGAWMSILTSNN